MKVFARVSSPSRNDTTKTLMCRTKGDDDELSRESNEKKKITFCKGSNEDCIADEKTANGKNMFL